MPEPTPDAVAALAEAMHHANTCDGWFQQQHTADLHIEEVRAILAALPEGWSLTPTPDPDAPTSTCGSPVPSSADLPTTR